MAINNQADYILINGRLVKNLSSNKGNNVLTNRQQIAPVISNKGAVEISAPIKTISKKKKKEEEEEEEKLKFFDSGAFGRDDISGVEKAVLGVGGTGLDVGVNIAKGILTPIEGLFDFVRHGTADVVDYFGGEKTAQEIRDIANKSDMDTLFGWTDDYFDKNSMLARTSESTVQGLGQVASMMIPAGIGQAVGLGTKGVTALTSGWTGISSMGSGRSEAYLGGATDDEAKTYGLINGVVEAGTELLFGGLGKTIGAVGYSSGLSNADDMLAKNLSNKLTNVLSKNLKVSGNTLNIAGNTVELGVKASAEGFEEVIAGLGNALGKKFTYMSEEELGEIIEDENLLESFVVGALTSGIAQSGVVPGMKDGSYIEANKQGRDFVTGYTQNEQAVIDKEVESRIKEAEAEGTELDSKAKKEIEKQVKAELEKGDISIDSIERTLGSESYTEYDNLVKESEEFEKLRNTTGAEMTDVMTDRLAELKAKNSEKSYKDLIAEAKQKIADDVRSRTANDRFLQESYKEKAKRSEVFQADLTKYDTKQQAVIQKAVDSGILNNTRKTHEFVDMVAKISADKGVSFDFTNNEKLSKSKFALQGKTINGYVENGNVTLNIDSNKALNSVVGHEIVHVMEGTELYTELQNAIKEYATMKGDYTSRLDLVKARYEGVEGAVIENEVTADLIGDYLFTDSDFVSKLSTEKPNLFKKIYDEIKYLVKIATGSKEAKQLAKVKKAFDKAYKEATNKDTGTRYSLSDSVDSEGRILTKEQQEFFKDSKVRNENGKLLEVYHGTKTNGINIFEYSKNRQTGTDFGEAYYFTSDLAKANGYSYDVEKDTRVQEYQNERKRLISKFLETKDEKYREAFKNVKVDGKTLNELMNDETYNTGGEVKKVYLNLKNPLIVNAEGEYYYKVYEGYFKEAKENGHDGIIVKNVIDNPRGEHRPIDVYIAFNNNQMKNVDNTNPTDNPDIRYSMGKAGKKFGNYNVYGSDVALETNQEVNQDLTETSEEVAPTGQEIAPSVENLQENEENLYEDDFAPMTEEEAKSFVESDEEWERMRTLQEVEEPQEVEAPIYNSLEANDPFEERDIKEVGNRKVKAYMYENPEVKPYFQEEAQIMLGELRNSIKGERVVNAQVLYDTNGEAGVWGTKRETSEELAYLLDTFKYTYAELEKGLNAIIEDNGKENNAVSKRIEFMLDERLRLGHTDFMSGYEVPPNQEYISTLVEKEVSEYSDEAWNNWLSQVAEQETTQEEVENVAPIKKAEAVKEEVPLYEAKARKGVVEGQQSMFEEESELDKKKRLMKNRFEQDKKNLRAEYDKQKAEALKQLEDKGAFIRNQAKELYTELANIRKGVKASSRLGYLLDVTGADWKGLKIALANVQAKPMATVNVNENSSTESWVRETLLREYDEKVESANFDFDNEYETTVKELEFEYETKLGNLERVVNRQTKQKELREFVSDLMGDTSKWTDKKYGIQYQTNTLKRNLRDIVRDKNGNRDIEHADRIYDELQGKYNRNEALLNKEANSIKKQFADMKLTKAENVYIQMLGEFRHNPETTVTNLELEEFYNEHKKHINVEKVDKAIERARELYDSLYEKVNESLKEHGFAEIGYKKGYFPHFTEEKQSILGKIFNWKTQNFEIPTDIAGLTEEFTPQRSWQSFSQHRQSDVTDYNFAKGLDNYVQGALDWIYHIEDIQKRRAFETEIRYRHSDEKVQQEIDRLRKNESLTTEELTELIESKLKEADNPLGNFLIDFRNATNNLAGKKSTEDRTMEYRFNRQVYSTMTNISNRVTANMVVGSVSASLSNLIPITQSWGQVSPISSLRAMGDTIKSAIKDDGTISKSTFLTNRLARSENLYKTNWDKVTEKVAFMMNVIDSFTSQTVWRSKYMENIQKGMSENEAIRNADQFAENVIAGRSRGNMPTIFNAKNPLAKVFTAFQLEVSNQYGYMFKDMPQDTKNEGTGKLVKGYATMFMGAYVYNELMNSIMGRDVAFDPIGIIQDFLADLFGDDDEEEDVLGALGGLAENVTKNIPFVGGLMGGGRVPLSSALPYENPVDMVASTVTDIAEGDWGTVIDEWTNPLYYVALPVGGGQLRKTIQGLSMFDDEHPVSGSYTQSGNLRFAVEDTFLKRLQAGVFGQYSSSEARQYFDEGRNPLKEKQIQELADLDMPIKEFWEYRDGLKEQSTLEEKFDYIAGLDLPVKSKNIMINNIVDRKEKVDMSNYDDFGSYEEFDFYTKNTEKYNFLEENGVSYSEYKSSDEAKEEYDSLYEWYNNYPEKVSYAKAITDNLVEYKRMTKAIDEISADKDRNGNSISGTRKTKVINYVNSLELSVPQKAMLIRKSYSSFREYNKQIVEYVGGLDISYEEKISILAELEMYVDDNGYVTWK